MDISNVSFDFNSMTQGQDVFQQKQNMQQIQDFII